MQQQGVLNTSEPWGAQQAGSPFGFCTQNPKLCLPVGSACCFPGHKDLGVIGKWVVFKTMALEELAQGEKISPIFRKRNLWSRFKKAYPERAEGNLEFGVTEAKSGAL